MNGERLTFNDDDDDDEDEDEDENCLEFSV